MNDNLPPLPDPILTHKYEHGEFYPLLVGPCFSLQQMREYGQICRQQALEEAAKVADLSWVKDPRVTASDAIRSLK